MKQMSAFRWQDRFKVGSIHLGISLTIAVLAAVLVFGIWYPYPYREISGGRGLFLLVVTVDVILGSLIIFAVFNRSRPRAELVRDLTVVGLIQLAALGYGLWTVAVARPVHLMYEFDRFRVVHAVDVPAATLMALQGASLSARPDLWQDYAQARGRVLAAAKPVTGLRDKFPARAAEIDAAVAKTSKAAGKLLYLPLVSRASTFWTVLLDANSAQVQGFIPLDPF